MFGTRKASYKSVHHNLNKWQSLQQIVIAQLSKCAKLVVFRKQEKRSAQQAVRGRYFEVFNEYSWK